MVRPGRRDEEGGREGCPCSLPPLMRREFPFFCKNLVQSGDYADLGRGSAELNESHPPLLRSPPQQIADSSAASSPQEHEGEWAKTAV